MVVPLAAFAASAFWSASTVGIGGPGLKGNVIVYLRHRDQ
jgi:hypothetical protein